MELLRLAGATLNQTPLDFAGNLARTRAIIYQARQHHVQLLCLPELVLTGYGCEDAFFSIDVAQKALASLLALLPDTVGITVVIGFPYIFQGALYNCAALVQNGQILGISPKRVLPREGVHYEPRWFRPWPMKQTTSVTINNQKIPFGDHYYQLGSVGLAIEICEEAWASVPAAAAVAEAVQVIMNPSASHFALGKYQKREHLVANSSRSMQAIYVYTNLVGCEAGRMIYDGGVLIAEGGEIVARGPRFGFDDGTITYHDINPDLATVAKLKSSPVYAASQDHLKDSLSNQGTLTKSPPPEADSRLSVPAILGLDPRHLDKITPKTVTDYITRVVDGSEYQKSLPSLVWSPNEEFLQAEMLGLFDYLRKSGHHGFVVSLSGGVDSATCAVLVAHMITAVTQQLGSKEFATRLNIKSFPSNTESWIQKSLLCVYQKTSQSGRITENAAKSLATALGAEFHVVDIEPIVQGFLGLGQQIAGRPLTWESDDTTLQNIQARSRAPLVWLLANMRRFLLLTTSNRSEAAVGYATMDGDTAGGLAPLAGIDKPFLRRWLVWAKVTEQTPLGPIPALEAITSQNPTAELRPATSAQTDEQDLMPYPILERIERYMIRDRLGPKDILVMLGRDFPDEPPAQLLIFLKKFSLLWGQNQWKRERIAPGFHLDDISLDPKSYCRYPILTRPNWSLE